MTELQLIPNVHRATHRIGLHIAKCPGVSVSQGEAHILAHLHAQGDSTIAELFAALEHKRSTLTSILDRLAERKFVTRESDSRDRRSFVVKLTPGGARAASKIHQHLEKMEQRALTGVSAADLKRCNDLIRRIAQNTEN